MRCTLNGQPVDLAAAPGESLATALRKAGATEVRLACGTGDCGSCSVGMDGRVIHACITPAHRAKGCDITTGLGPGAALHDVQDRLLNGRGFQCGFCTAGFAVTAAHPGAGVERFKGSLCRCTGYTAIAEALDGPPPSAQAVDDPRIVTGALPFCDDTQPDGLVHIKLLRADVARARITRIDAARALRHPGVIRVLTHEDAPALRYSTARHAHEEDSIPDLRLFDDAVRFHGQRIAAIVAETETAATEALALVDVEYDIIPPMVSALDRPDDAPEICRIDWQQGIDCPPPDLRTVELTMQSQRLQHVHLEPHVSIARFDDDGRLDIRTSSQVPFLTRDLLARLFGLPPDRLRLHAPRVGGGFGGKQETLTEDVVALATLLTGRPTRLCLDREEEFTATTSRHPMRVTARMAATADGHLQDLRLTACADTGAYANHAPQVLAHACHEPVGTYRAAFKSVTARALGSHSLPAGAFRSYGLAQTVLAVECAMDALGRATGLDPVEIRRRNLVPPGGILTTPVSDGRRRDDTDGLDWCLAAVADSLGPGEDDPDPADWRIGQGLALSMIDTLEPRGHPSEARIELTSEGIRLRTGTVEFGNGASRAHKLIAAEVLGVGEDRITLWNGDTDAVGEDSGAFGSTGLVVAGQAVRNAAENLAARLRDLAAARLGCPAAAIRLQAGQAVGPDDRRLAVVDLAQGGPVESSARVSGGGAIAWNVQGFRLAVHRVTSEIRVIRSVHAADAGRVIDPVQCRGQVSGSIIQGLGACLGEDLRIAPDGRAEIRGLRDYPLPQMGEFPATRIHFAPARARPPLPMSESPIATVAPAFCNAIFDATGWRASALPVRPWHIPAASEEG